MNVIFYESLEHNCTCTAKYICCYLLLLGSFAMQMSLHKQNCHWRYTETVVLHPHDLYVYELPYNAEDRQANKSTVCK